VRLAGFTPAEAKILDRSMQRVRRQRAVDALAFELLRAYFGAQVNRQASAPAVLIEGPRAHA